jgi:hypothetical protein
VPAPVSVCDGFWPAPEGLQCSVPGVADDLDDLARPLAVPVDGLTDAELLAAVRQAERIRSISRERTGRLLAEMHARGKPWPQIARETGIRQTNAYGWPSRTSPRKGDEER